MISANKENKQKSKLVVVAKSKGLHLLEKLSHWFKVFSLKIHNWNENKLKLLKKKKTEADVEKKEVEEKIFSKRRVIPVSRRIDIQISKKEQEEIEMLKEKEKDELAGAMISKKATYPEDRKDELEKSLIERIAADPRDIEAYERLGDYYVSLGNQDDAKECYKQVLRLNPQSLRIKGKLGKLERLNR